MSRCFPSNLPASPNLRVSPTFGVSSLSLLASGHQDLVCICLRQQNQSESTHYVAPLLHGCIAKLASGVACCSHMIHLPHGNATIQITIQPLHVWAPNNLGVSGSCDVHLQGWKTLLWNPKDRVYTQLSYAADKQAWSPC